MLKAFFTAIWVLFVAAIAALFMLIPFHDAVGTLIFDAVNFLQANWPFSLLFALITGLSLWLFAVQFRVTDKTQMPSSVVLQVEDGEVRIALTAIETLVQQAASQIKGVKETRPNFFTLDEGLGVNIRAVVASDESIPELSSQLQKVIKDHVLRIAGIHIEEVKVLVENVSAGARNRVELR